MIFESDSLSWVNGDFHVNKYFFVQTIINLRMAVIFLEKLCLNFINMPFLLCICALEKRDHHCLDLLSS